MWAFLYKSFLLTFCSIFLLLYNNFTQCLQHFRGFSPLINTFALCLWFSVSVPNLFIFSHVKYSFKPFSCFYPLILIHINFILTFIYIFIFLSSWKINLEEFYFLHKRITRNFLGQGCFLGIRALR